MLTKTPNFNTTGHVKFLWIIIFFPLLLWKISPMYLFYLCSIFSFFCIVIAPFSDVMHPGEFPISFYACIPPAELFMFCLHAFISNVLFNTMSYVTCCGVIYCLFSSDRKQTLLKNIFFHF